MSAAESERPVSSDTPGRAWVDLCEAVSSVRMAVQILNGPLNPTRPDGVDHEALRSVLATLDTATRRLANLVHQLQPAANDEGPAEPSAVPCVEPTKSPRPRSKPSPAHVGDKLPEAAQTVGLDGMLDGLAVAVPAQFGARAQLSLAVPKGLVVRDPECRLVGVLQGALNDAFAAGPPGDPRVELRAWLDPVEDLGDAMDVVFEIRPDARAHAFAPEPRGPGADDGIRVEVRRQGKSASLLVRIGAASA